jgi:ubiquinone/menaquinone biosynthesis C-methylase UbiE
VVLAPGEVVGLELSPEMVAQARALAAERGVANARFEGGDLLALPFPDTSFDAAFESAVLEHVPDPIHLVQATLGHASVATTSTYLHARPTDSSARSLGV